MTKEELISQGWKLTYSGPCNVSTWGEFMVHLRHESKRMVSGYGINDAAALQDAINTIQNSVGALNNEIFS